ncbi:intradiol ring-cleavage dioxygenase [Pseudomonas monsensis]|uniref:intradiol ring-cleavage dioxygenase n=1 Tax=Pseudomonas monsensis TaxID=2745509 RepID=UPI003D1EE679
MDPDFAIPVPCPVYQLAPEQIAGPFFRDPKLLRRNISEGADGLPLLLRLTIVDAMTAEPVVGARVDIWHCNARGANAGGCPVNQGLDARTAITGDDDTYLRGSQFCDARGRVRFTTIYPDSHAGRALHLHVAVRMVVGDEYPAEHDVAWTGELQLPEIISRPTHHAKAWGGRTSMRLNNASDSLPPGMGREASTLYVWPIGRDSHEDGYFGHLTIGIDTFAVSSQIKPEDFDKYTL